jgi:cytochrome c peroxidase
MCLQGSGSQKATRFGLPFVVALTLVGCGGAGNAPIVDIPQSSRLSALAQLGEKIFHDPSLSSSGQMSCASCHDEAHGFASADAFAVPLGGTAMDQSGTRNAPSLKYLVETTPFFFDGEGTPTGGFNRDGRSKDFADQAQRPFMSSNEMGNVAVSDVVAKLSAASYVSDITAIFGAQALSDADAAFLDARLALQAYQRESVEFAPYSSKYDFFLAGKTTLNAQETRGLVLFNDPNKGNCAGCHPSGRRAGGLPPLFTDFTYDNLGVPRNADIEANEDPDYFDLGLCGPQRAELADRGDLCGAFKVPTLRNVGVTAPYFHNGKFATLRELVEFYVRRDTNPEQFYPIGPNGQPQKFNDLPPQYAVNVNTTEVPYNRQLGDQPALSDTEIDDVVAFMNTLTDGYNP